MWSYWGHGETEKQSWDADLELSHSRSMTDENPEANPRQTGRGHTGMHLPPANFTAYIDIKYIAIRLSYGIPTYSLCVRVRS